MKRALVPAPSASATSTVASVRTAPVAKASARTTTVPSKRSPAASFLTKQLSALSTPVSAPAAPHAAITSASSERR